MSLVMVALAFLSACAGETAAPAATQAGSSSGSGKSVTETVPTRLAATPVSTAAPIADMAAAATAQGTAAGSPGAAGGGEVKIGFAFAMSGGNAAYGASQRSGAELAISEINASGQGPKITAIFEDTAAKPEQAVAVFRKYISSDNVDAIIGPTLSSEAASSDPEAQKAGVPVLAVSNTAAGITDIGDYIYRDSLAEFQVIPFTVKEAKAALNLAKVSMLYARDDPFSKSDADVFRQELQSNGIHILGEQTFSTNDVDYRAQLATIKRENPDAIVVSALATPAQVILRQARNEVAIDPRIHIIGGNGFNSPAVLEAAGPAAEGTIVGTAWSVISTDPLSRQFVLAYRRSAGKDPDQPAAQAYAGVYILYDAIKRANIGSKPLQDARTAIRDALKSTSGVPTVLGTFSFTDKRDASHPPVIQIVRDGKFQALTAGGGSGNTPAAPVPTSATH